MEGVGRNEGSRFTTSLPRGFARSLLESQSSGRIAVHGASLILAAELVTTSVMIGKFFTATAGG
jgi:hypothetical protein